MLKDRLKEVRKVLKISSQKDFATALNWKIGRIQDLESGKVQELKASEAEEIQEKFLISGWWLLTGNGEMLVKQNDYTPAVCDKGMVQISYYPDVNAAGGYGALNGDARFEVMDVSRSFLSTCFGLSHFAGIDVIHVVGDSMEPFIQNGEIIILQRSTSAKNNQIVVVRIEDEIFVKRLVKDPLGRWLKFTSENHYYPDIDLEGNDLLRVQIIGIVIGKFKAF